MKLNKYSLPTDLKDVKKLIILEEMNENYAQHWHYNIQKKINNSTENRADKGWNWPNIYSHFRKLASLLNQDPKAYCLIAEGHENSQVMIGMILLVCNYPHLNDKNINSTFLWFFTTAPDDYIFKMTGRKFKAVGSALFDTALAQSFHCNHNGLIGLHAAPKGGTSLLDYYKSLELINLDKKIKLKRTGRRNDGRYFVTNREIADKIWEKNINIRVQP